MDGIWRSPSSLAMHSGIPAREMYAICVVELPNAMPSTVCGVSSVGVEVIFRGRSPFCGMILLKKNFRCFFCKLPGKVPSWILNSRLYVLHNRAQMDRREESLFSTN